MNNQRCISSDTPPVICCTDGHGKNKCHRAAPAAQRLKCALPEMCIPLVFSGGARKGVSDIRRRMPREEQKGPEVFP